ncbi:MAG TPA: hypothetical protein ENK46_14865 [Flavobacteriia bacterium]|jgi:hypothetical protein|nr:hypothetical protein [Flavobacteriia bacterium]
MSLRQKNIALFIGILLLGWLAYYFSFAKTMALKEQYVSLQKEQVLLHNVSQKLIQLKQQEVYYDSILASKKISAESSFQNTLLKTIAGVADSTKIRIVSFNNPHVYKSENAMVNTYNFTLRGGFTDIVRLVYVLEQQSKLGTIISVHFIKKKDYRRNTYFLEGTVFLQQIEPF